VGNPGEGRRIRNQFLVPVLADIYYFVVERGGEEKMFHFHHNRHSS